MEPPSTPTILDPLLGKTVAERYFIEKKLGVGGMGAVYLARHVTLDKQVALKVLHGDFVHRPELLERFLQEARSASRIRHENVIDITDFGTTPDGVVFFAMEVLEGKDLHDVVVEARKAGEVLPWPRIRHIFLQICAALSAAHACGVVHRDMKPENVFLIEKLGHKDFVKLLDFGIAKLSESDAGERKLTRTGMLFGTPEYMAPEQARGEAVDHRADIYAMGCLLYLLLAGRVPFEGDSVMAVLGMQLGAAPPPIPPAVFEATGAPRGLTGVLARALAKERDERFATIDEMMAAIESMADGDAGDGSALDVPWPEAPGPAPGRELPGPDARAGDGGSAAGEVPGRARRGRPVLWLGVGLVLVAGAGLGAMRWMDRGAPVEPAQDLQAGELPAPIEPAVLPAEPEAEPALPARVTLTLRSEPEGASILDGAGQMVGETPLTFEMPGGHDPRRFRFRLEGHYDKLVELIPSEDVDYTVALVPRPAALAGAGDAPGIEPEPEVEVVPQERAERRRRRVERSRKRDQEEPTGTPGGPGPTPAQESTAARPGDEPAGGADTTPAGGAAPAPGAAPAGGADTTPAGGAAPGEGEPASGRARAGSTPRSPAPGQPDPTSDPVLKNPFAE